MATKVKDAKRGSTNNSNRLEAFAKSSHTTGADWGTCSPEKIHGVVMAITELGGAVTFGLSRDNGAHMLTLLLDGHRETLWFNGDSDLDSPGNECFRGLIRTDDGDD